METGDIVITINGNNLTLERFMKVIRYKAKVKIDPRNIDRIEKARKYVVDIVNQGKPVYGINTGFGKLANVVIEKEHTRELQKNLLMSHACGVGEPFSEEVARGMMLLRINALIKGYSGIRYAVLEVLLEMLNKGVTPVVFSQGSLGASGDLAPLAHMSLPLLGLGEVFYKGIRMDAASGLRKAGIKPLPGLEAKEGLCLINGTQAMTASGAITLYDALMLEKQASLSLAMTMEALEAIVDAFDSRIQVVRGHKGQEVVSRRVLGFLSGSLSVTHDGEKRVQDAYSLRCAPQVHGAVYDAMQYVKSVIETEMNAVTDNPVLFVDSNQVISAGNFHGEPVAFVLDHLSLAIAELANISERRIERMVNSSLSNGLTPFLATKPGINSGFMIVQYSAAALVSENKSLAHPASVDSIPSSANQEDHVSMGTIGALKAQKILENARKVIGMELFTACQAIDMRHVKQLGLGTQEAYTIIRNEIPFLEQDEIMYPMIHRMEAMIMEEKFRKTIDRE